MFNKIKWAVILLGGAAGVLWVVNLPTSNLSNEFRNYRNSTASWDRVKIIAETS